ncbi:MAG: discoidin domain-containing protein [Paludibacteraceae bacterium]|nr:discoidin domain-containing protein [Paludibacteraceae bacterium]
MKHKLTLLFALLCASMMSFAAIDWSAYEWLGNGSGNEAYTSKIKVATAEGQSVVNLQKPGWAAEAGIYTYFGAGIQSCSLPEGKYAIDGAGICLYLSAFTAKETEVTIVDANKTYVFTVYYEDGVAGGAGGEGTESEPTEIWDVNFALQSQGATATAKSGNNPGEANDGNEGSRWWSATGTDEAPMTEEEEHDQWWQVNLGQRRIFNTIQILWEGAWGKSFDIQISDDGAAWTTVKQIRDQNIAGPFPYLQTIELDEKKIAQYVRFQGIERGTGYAYSFWEFSVLLPNVSVLTTIDLKAANTIAKVGGDGIVLTTTAKDQNGNPMSGIEITYVVTPAAAGSVEGGKYIPEKIGEATIVAKSGEVTSDAIQVFGVNSDNLALNKPATAGHDNANANLSNNANTEDRWGSNGATHYNGGENSEFGDWWYVDLGVKYDINGIAIRWETARPNDYDIRVSDDAITWTNIGTFNDYPVANVYEFYQGLSAVPGRYIGVWARNGYENLAYGISMYDFQAFGTPAATPTKTVSASVNDAAMGTATVTQGGEEVDEVETGSEVTFSAEANDGYVFVEWSNGEKNATFTTTVDAALNLTATFRKLGTTYCNTLVQSTNGGQEHDAYVTMKRTAENEYTLVVRSAEAMLNFGGVNFYMQPNTHVIDLRNQGTLSADKRTLIATFSAEKEPYMTTPLYVVLDGGFEAHFPQLTNIEYTVSCEDPEITAMVLNHSTAVLETGNTITLEPIFTPTFMSADVTWETSNADVATVSNGVVTAISAGEATITAKVSETITATCIITVQTATAHNWYGYATDQELDYTYRIEYTIDHHIVAHVKRQGEKVGLVDASMLIGDKWTVINNTEGEEEGWKKGVTEQTYTIGEELTILIQSNYAGEPSKIYINYIVGSDNTMPTIEPSQLSLNTNSLTLGVSDEDIQLVAEIHHCDAANKTLTWTSSNEAAVTVVDGKVHPVAVGTATITATTHNGISATCEVTVVGALEAVTWYGVTTIQVNGNPVGVNYSITRTSERKLQFYYSLAESIEELGNTSVVFKETDTWNTMMKLDANERTAEFTSESTYIDGSTIGIFFHLPFAGGAGRWDVDYIVGSSNEKPNTLVAFGDQADNTAKIAEYANEVVDAYINRTFPNTDEWYTLCLPFDMDEAQLAATFGAGYTLATLGNSEDRGSLIHLNFNYVNTLKAGKPYLLKPGVSTVIVPMIEAVTIKNVDPSAAPQKAESAHMHFQGTFVPTTLEGDNKRFVGPNNYLYSPAEGGTNMKSFRCYFTIPVESQALVGSKAARIVLGPQVATGTENVQSDQVQSTKVIIDGTLYIIRGERTYNAQGQLVK